MYALRPVFDTDEEHRWLVETHNDPVVLRNLTNNAPITLESHLVWWNRIQRNHLEERLIFCVNGERAGFTKFYSIGSKSCLLGADLHRDYRGKGHAGPMWQLMLERCFIYYNLEYVELTTAEYNEIAQRVYKKLGFREIYRKTGSLIRENVAYDEIVMRLDRNEWKNEESSADR